MNLPVSGCKSFLLHATSKYEEEASPLANLHKMYKLQSPWSACFCVMCCVECIGSKLLNFLISGEKSLLEGDLYLSDTIVIDVDRSQHIQ